ncbi:MAG: ABC transporter permease, partial [Cyclobacteriaceae bacterium]
MPFFHARLFSRIIAKSREVYLLKIISLAVAFAASTLVGLFALNEFGYDRFHNDHASIFRLLQRNNAETYSGNRLSNRIPPEALSKLKAETGDSMVLSRVKLMSELSIISPRGIFNDQRVHAADAAITKIFSFDILDGSLIDFDPQRQAVIISCSTAQKFFGDRHAAGTKIKITALGDTLLFTVAAVYNDFPENTHEAFNIFIAFNSLSVNALQFNPDDAGVYGRVFPPAPFFEDWVSPAEKDEMVYRFQPISEIYFGPAVIGDNAKHGDRYSIIILICITALIFFLALTSFINLTTLTLPNRAKELAVKKLAGTSQWDLVKTFAKESFAIVAIALILGLGLLLLTSPLTEPILSINFISLLLKGDFFLILILAGLF